MPDSKFRKGDIVYIILENRVQKGTVVGIVFYDTSTKYDVQINALGKRACFEGELYASKEDLVARV